MARLSVDERFERYTDKSNINGCWLWKGALGKDGYTSMLVNGKHYSAHKYSYLKYKGRVPDGMHVHHKCRVRHCVNPDHLECVHPSNHSNLSRKGLYSFPKDQRIEPIPLKERLLRFIKIDEKSGCWIWQGYLDTKGYGAISVNTEIGRKILKSHRVSYEIYKDKIPLGLQIDHLCRNRACCNPEHLEAVTSRENSYRGLNIFVLKAKQTHCKYGHEFTLENTLRDKSNNRRCKICSTRINREKARRHYRKKKGGIVGLSMSARTHCKRGHPLFGGNLYNVPSGGRACKECKRMERREYRKNNRELVNQKRRDKRRELKNACLSNLRS